MNAPVDMNAALADYPLPPPVAAVSYTSQGRVLIIGESLAALDIAGRLPDTLSIQALLPAGLILPASSRNGVLQGDIVSLTGWLGNFSLDWQHQGDVRKQVFDLVLDLREMSWFTMHQPPQGYFAPRDETSLQQALAEIVDGVGEFEKPRFFEYAEKLCAHSRAQLDGCNACIDICSTRAISADGDHIKVEPHLCMGCGACASVCPSGAMQFNFPSMSYWGGKLKTLLKHYREQGGRHACLLLHAPADDPASFQQSALPDDALPLEVFHIASIGLDWLLGALALGANRVAILATGKEAPQYLVALRQQMQLAEQILAGLGYGSDHFRLIETPAQLQSVLAGLPPASTPLDAASFTLFNDKRTTLEACLDHFIKQAPAPVPEVMPLAAGAPFGTVVVDGGKCTLCLSCVSACPASALRDGDGAPALRFVERNCLQCGLCESACPEDAISLSARLLLTPEARQARTLHQDQPFHCVRCGKAFATTHMIGSILSKLAGHSMFTTPEAKRRLQMCGDCRVIDMMTSGEPMTGTRP